MAVTPPPPWFPVRHIGWKPVNQAVQSDEVEDAFAGDTYEGIRGNLPSEAPAASEGSTLIELVCLAILLVGALMYRYYPGFAAKVHEALKLKPPGTLG